MNYQYLIIGGGMTGAAAADGIREVDADWQHRRDQRGGGCPYNRPPLSKGLWKGDPLDSIWRKTKGKAPELHLDREIKEILPEGKTRDRSRQEAFSTYEKLLLATGGQPRRLPFEDDQIIYYRTLADYRRLRALSEKGERFAVIGGGFIGSEIAAALTMNGKKVALIFPGHDVGERLFPRDLARYVSGVYRAKGGRAGARRKGCCFRSTRKSARRSKRLPGRRS